MGYLYLLAIGSGGATSGRAESDDLAENLIPSHLVVALTELVSRLRNP